MKFSMKSIVTAVCLMVGTLTVTAQTVTVKSGENLTTNPPGISCNGQNEDQSPVILVKDGGKVTGVTIPAGLAADGIHCEGNCTLTNVKWPDVCEDAATMKGGSGKTMTISGGTVANAADKIIQHNGVGSTVSISGLTVNGTNGKLYRSCGNCGTQGKRTLKITSLTINGTLSSGIAGINRNYGDVATITGVKWKGWSSTSTSTSQAACVTYIGNNSGGSVDPTGKTIEWGTANCVVTKDKKDIESF